MLGVLLRRSNASSCGRIEEGRWSWRGAFGSDESFAEVLRVFTLPERP